MLEDAGVIFAQLGGVGWVGISGFVNNVQPSRYQMEHGVAHMNDVDLFRDLMKNFRCTADFDHYADNSLTGSS